MELNRLQFENWRKGIMELLPGESRLHGETQIIAAVSKKIYSEYRFFVVADKIITHSMYKQGYVVNHKNEMDDDVYNFTQKMVNKWSPASAYVIDVANTPNGPKVVELNAFGSSGFYKCDKQKIIMAVENLLDT